MMLELLEPEARARVERTFSALETRGVRPLFVTNREAALSMVRDLIPRGSRVAHGTSTTLLEIGLVEYLKRPDSAYTYLNPEWQAEADAALRGRLRARLSVEADYFLGSVQAICETGEVIAADRTGSRQAFYVFGPRHVIWVAGLNKLVPSLADGMTRLREVALPREDKRIKATGGSGSYIGKIVIYERQEPGRTTLVLVGEALGF